jgi:protein SCO1/2
MRVVITGICLMLAAGVGFLTFDWYYTRNMAAPYGVPFTLVSSENEAVTQTAFRGHPTAVFFGYTHCEDVCPTTLFEMGEWLEEIGSEGKNIKVWFVTVDPERDSPEVLESYLSNFSARIEGMTGRPEKVHEMLSGFSIYFRKTAPDHSHASNAETVHSGTASTSDNDAKNYGMAHTTDVLMLDSRGRLFGTIHYQEDAKSAQDKLRNLARS